MTRAANDGPPRLFDVVIIGAGQAGVPLAHDLASAGRRVLLVERKHLGGSCVNFGCTPTKAALASAQVAHDARHAAEFGVRVGEVHVNFADVMERARRVSRESRQGLEASFDPGGDPALLRGHARLAGRGEHGVLVHVGDEVVEAPAIVLNTGTRSLVPDVEGLRDGPFLHAGNWLELDERPEHVVMLGGGYIGVEMSQFYRRVGARVTLVDRGEHLLGREDEDVSDALRGALENEGVEFRLASHVERIAHDAGAVRVHVTSGDRRDVLDASHVFVATGRRPNTDDLGLETLGVRVNEQGVIEVDERLSTSEPGVWAAGDVRGGPMFTHTAWDDYRVLASQLTGDGSRTTRRLVPYGVFTDPQLGRVGLSEREARDAGRAVRVARYDLNRNGKANELGRPDGFIKLLVDANDDLLLGAAVLASQGAELVHVYVDLMNADAPRAVLANAVHVHPTLSEAVQSVAREFDRDPQRS
ncbi:mercuric reductase [Deinococcus yavapaiensis]|uniref:Pyruvate/2-oxoglutarate dehydrogenase complex dihydrolipoamide dehydrogenase (E3) component n=1 Tax=Deinococcus yavapaiensis KR-236 TaxID=694435 RepID=A0A318S2R4_9DEIO|nr:mercuric reductase [Deinococcus yavapaiensis]PYE49948.1 pyruvate/2-oxoglutarate dehydrogenase complex dihydrolipoamide dehydrogenase (E3) component [Deinococcus yavapaiensis KR-236]